MQREYMEYVAEACKKGMTPEEVTYLFTNIYNKSNTKNGKSILRLFAKGIGGTKKHTLNMQVQAPNPNMQYVKQQ